MIKKKTVKRTGAKKLGRPAGAKRGRPAMKKAVKTSTKKLGRPAGKRGRPAGSKNLNPRNVEVKAHAPQIESTDFARHAMQLSQQNVQILDHMLDLLKAQVFDAYRQFTDHALRSGQSYHINIFINLFKATITLHGITPDQLIAALDPEIANLVMEALENVEPTLEEVKPKLTRTRKPKDTPKPAEGVDLSGFGIESTPVDPITEELPPVERVVDEVHASAGVDVDDAPVSGLDLAFGSDMPGFTIGASNPAFKETSIENTLVKLPTAESPVSPVAEEPRRLAPTPMEPHTNGVFNSLDVL